MQFWSVRTLALASSLTLAVAGCAADGGFEDETDDAIESTQQAYSPPACGSECVSRGVLPALDAASRKYGFPRWFIYATVHRESSFDPNAKHVTGSGTGPCDVGYGLTQMTCPHHDGLSFPQGLSSPNQSHASWQGDMRISRFCSETGLCPWIDMKDVTKLTNRYDPVQNLDRYFSGYAAPAYYLEAKRAPKLASETQAQFQNRILRRVAWHWRYGHYASFTYPTDPGSYFSGPDQYRWDNYASTYRAAVEAEDGVWNGNVARPPYASATSGGSASSPSTAKLDFEGGDEHGFSLGTSTTAKPYSGSSSLAVSLSGSGSQSTSTKSSLPPPYKTVTFRVWIPTGSKISWVQAYAQQTSAGNWAWTTATKNIAQLTPGAWNTLTLTTPATIASLGLQFGKSASWSGTVYVDSVSW